MHPSEKIYIAVIGVGGVGTHVLSQLHHITTTHPQISLILISRTTRNLFTETFATPIPLSTWHHDLSQSTQPLLTVPEILTYLRTAPGKCILIDNTSSLPLSRTYPTFLHSGISIVTPNKKAFSDSYALWSDIFSAAYSANPTGGLVYHESSVGAGLPVISTLKDLVATGDDVTRIEGVFSGTMSFLFNNFAPTQGKGGKWSEEVCKAKEAGFTEPDPRDDLNGVDVARKLVILARLVGLKTPGTDSFPVQSLIPDALREVQSGEEFMQQLSEFDDEMEDVKIDAERQDKVIRFVGSIDVKTGGLKVGLEMFERAHPIAALKGSDNIIIFYTRRYGANPLIVQGAGAGGEVTAMGVTADLIKVVERLSK